jgi:hypothetical protein
LSHTSAVQLQQQQQQRVPCALVVHGLPAPSAASTARLHAEVAAALENSAVGKVVLQMIQAAGNNAVELQVMIAAHSTHTHTHTPQHARAPHHSRRSLFDIFSCRSFSTA